MKAIAMKKISGIAVIAALVGLPASAQAAGVDEDALRLSKEGHSVKWNWTPPGQGDRYGHAEVLVNAPLASVRAHVQDFAHYKDFAPARFTMSRVVGHDKGSTDVYMKISVLHGAISLWNVTRFAPPRMVGANEVVEGKFVKGNVSDARVVWTMRSVDKDWTVVKCDILFKTDIPAPADAIDEELRDAAVQAVDGVHDKAQGHRGHVRWVPPAAPNSQKQ